MTTKITIHRDVEKIPYYPKAMAYGAEAGWIRLGSNENPFPPSPKVIEEMLDTSLAVNRYPGGEQELKMAIAAKIGLNPEEIIIGNGSNELIEMAMKGMKDDRRNGLVISDSSFAFYAIAARIYGYGTTRVPLAGMKIDLPGIRNAIDGNTRMVIINNPLNPTGTMYDRDEFDAFIKDMPPDVLLVVDEAYVEFVENKNFPDTLRFIHDHAVLILKTFSKAYGLAGLRVGYGIGEASLLSYIERTKQPFSVNMMALAAARVALSDHGYLEKVLSNNRTVKKLFLEALEKLGIEYVPTEANFVLVRIGERAEEITKKLFEKKIIVRWMGAYNLPEHIRITFGKRDENAAVITALERIMGAPKTDRND